MSVFSFRQAGIVWVKECWDAFRDRRTLLMIILPALIAGPLFLMIIFQVLSTQNERAVSPVLHVQGEQYAPALIAFLKRQQVQIMPLPQDYEHQIKRGDIAIAMIVPPQFPEEVQKGDAATVHLLYDRSRDRAQVTIAQVERLIYAYSRQWGQLRLLMRGVATEVAQPITVRVTDYATPQQSGALILSLVAFYTLFAALVGGMALALDLSAGERERFSLQPLLLTPIQPVELVVGKWATVALVNSIFVALTLIGFYLTLTYAPLPAIGVPFLFHAQEAMKFIVVLLPLALFFPALFFLIGLRGHSVRESQATTSVVLLLFSVIPMMQMLLPQKESQTISFYPVAGHYAMLTRILRGDALPAFDLAMIYIVPLALLLLVLFVATRVLSKGASYRP